MRADRLLTILLLLQTNPRLTAQELAARVEVSERTIYRDMDALSAAGIPVLAERGVGGGWSLLEDYRTNLTGLNLAEVQALFVSGSAQVMADLGLRSAAEGALLKLLAALPGSYRQDAEFMRQRIHIDGAGWKQEAEQVPSLPTIQEALWQERQLRIVYERHDGSVERQVDPYGLVAKGRIWYLIGGVDGEARTYRISRIQAAEILPEPSQRPAGFDLAAFWADSSAEFRAALPRYPVTFRVDPAILNEMRYLGRIEQIHPAGADGWQQVDMMFQIEAEARGYALGFGDRLEVLAPPDLRTAVITLAQAALRLYDCPR